MFAAREIPELSLENAKELIADTGDEVSALTSKIRVDLVDHPRVMVDEMELPHAGAVEKFAGLLNIPESFLVKQDADVQEYLINTKLARLPGVVGIRYSDMHIRDAFPMGKKIVDPLQVCDVASSVIPDARVVSWHRGGGSFNLDVVVPETNMRGAFQDPQVGDYCLGGLRFDQNLKTSKAPTVQGYWLRLICSNGYENLDLEEPVSLRGNTVDEFLSEFELLAERKFRALEATMEEFFNLRRQPVEDVEQAVVRYGREHSIPSANLLGLVEAIPAYFDGTVEENMFEVVNFFTNVAQSEMVQGPLQHRLERLGGHIVHDNSPRCGHCHQKVVEV